MKGKKLVLKKETVSILNAEKMSSIYGGENRIITFPCGNTTVSTVGEERGPVEEAG
jgi:hypothetical protein